MNRQERRAAAKQSQKVAPLAVATSLDRAFLAERPDIVDLTEQLTDFSDTAALVCCLDLVISVDTSVVHLAGALGAPVWTMLPLSPDWRWLLNRDDSPWYSSMRLATQTRRLGQRRGSRSPRAGGAGVRVAAPRQGERRSDIGPRAPLNFHPI